jgi:L-cysteine:1D-myo-inositol 2-amino-2-deoxy-alpha-D-glucopyranoside ligase
MPRAAARLDRWIQAAGAATGPSDQVLAEVRAALDADLDTPAAVAAIDAAAARGDDIDPAAALLGVFLTSDPVT